MARKKNTSKATKRKTAARKTARKNVKAKRANAKHPTSFFGFLIKWGIVAALWVGIIGVLMLAWFAKDLPDLASQAGFERRPSITIQDRQGNVITRYGEVKGESLAIADLPDHLIWAVLAVEDRRFYRHPGLDVIGLMRAALTNARAGHIVQGGSTITQQLAKNLFLSHERTYKRKIQEAMLAFWLEYELSKDEILSAYLNRVYLGGGTYGIDAASQLYFNKSALNLDLRESAIIAGMLKAPSRYSPIKNPGLTNERADIVLRAMVAAGYISDESAKSLSNPAPRPSRKPQGGNAVRYFSDWVIDGLDELIGVPEADLIIETTLDSRVQNNAASAISSTLRRFGPDRDMSQGAMIVMGLDGRILAMVGGKDYNQSQFNRAVQAKRQPGSSFKPFVYLTAIEQGWEPEDPILDDIVTDRELGSYRPKNFAGKYYGEVSLETALTFSMNTAAVRLMKEVGVGHVINTARRLGIISKLEPDLSLALGSSSVSMLELTTAYGALATGGLSVYPYGITKISDKSGRVYYSRERKTFARRTIEPDNVRAMNQMMRSVVEFGTGAAAQIGTPAAGKTGTSQNSVDAWFMGYTDKLVAGVWFGNDDNTPMKGVTGGSFPARVWRDVVSGSSRHVTALGDGLLAESAPTGLFDALLGRLSNEDETRWYSRGRKQRATDLSHEKQKRYND